jgi:hypothetical protein
MKNDPSAVNTLRTELTIAEYGRGARHQVCQAALGLRHMNSVVAEQTKEIRETVKILRLIPPQHKQTQALIKAFHAEGRRDLENEARHLATGIHELMIKTEAAYFARAWILNFYQTHCQAAKARFEQERYFATKDQKRALERLPKEPFQRVGARRARSNASAHIKAAILTYLGEKVTRAAAYTYGAPISYTEIARCNTRLMSDPVFQGCCLPSELPARNVKEARRIAKSLGIRLAKELKKPKEEKLDELGFPVTKIKLVPCSQEHLDNQANKGPENSGTHTPNRENSDQVRAVKDKATPGEAHIDWACAAAWSLRAYTMELKKMTAEGQIRGRSPVFARWMDYGKRPAIPNPLLKRGVSAVSEGT